MTQQSGQLGQGSAFIGWTYLHRYLFRAASLWDMENTASALQTLGFKVLSILPDYDSQHFQVNAIWQNPYSSSTPVVIDCVYTSDDWAWPHNWPCGLRFEHVYDVTLLGAVQGVMPPLQNVTDVLPPFKVMQGTLSPTEFVTRLPISTQGQFKGGFALPLPVNAGQKKGLGDSPQGLGQTVADGQALYATAYNASNGDLKGLSAAGLAIAKGLDDAGIHQVAAIAAATASGAAAGAAIGIMIPGIGSAVGAIIGAMIGFVQSLFGSGATQPPQDTRTSTAQRLVFPYDASQAMVQGWIRPTGATDNSRNAAYRIYNLGTLREASLQSAEDDWNWLGTYLGGNDPAVASMKLFLTWRGWAENKVASPVNGHWFLTHGMTPVPFPSLATDDLLCGLLPDCSQDSSGNETATGTDNIGYALAELAALNATSEVALQYMLSMGWLWTRGQIIDSAPNPTSLPPQWAKIIARINQTIIKVPPPPAPIGGGVHTGGGGQQMPPSSTSSTVSKIAIGTLVTAGASALALWGYSAYHGQTFKAGATQLWRKVRPSKMFRRRAR